jgi:ADP-ribose pyrophosphatase YjhB (NUDIX family)
VPAPDPARLRRSAVCAVIFDAQGRILLHRRSDNGYWALPGGGIERDESAQDAIVREVKEETGYDVEVVRFTGFYSDPKHTTIRYPDGNVVQYTAACFECRLIGGAFVANDESTAAHFFPPDALPEPFMPNHIPRLRDALERREAAFFR